ncbi:hypothetical protein HHL22_13985 [Hymenobacter sp. RP-2-7]|uniref:DUF2946 domain-containing protein n=1 Tax=Hymenobacter polaris TaxID=2682546 RepID=A0A7Y0AFA5_9BACT|nr:hypothetical protein [Hymenobacter polaris]NML66318.1 hypothetical protein [Hymenobacter polaris]
MMPRQLPVCYRLLSAFLALLVLATSVGLTAERHRCRISGRSTVALVLPGGLGHDAAAEAPTKPGQPCGTRKLALAKRADGCCDISHVLHKLDAKQHAGGPTKLLPEPPHWLPALLPALVWAGLGGTAPLAAGVAVGTAGGPSPPGAPRAGRVLLAFLGTLIV